jgi:large conductance mechanosensitive channel
VLKEFKDFLMKGNLLEIAVGLILALAFKAVVDSLVADVINQIVAGVFDVPDFSTLKITLRDADPLAEAGSGEPGAAIYYGRFLNAVISFVIVGFVLFLIVKAYNRMVALAKRQGETEETPEDSAEVVLLREIRDQLARRP